MFFCSPDGPPPIIVQPIIVLAALLVWVLQFDCTKSIQAILPLSEWKAKQANLWVSVSGASILWILLFCWLSQILLTIIKNKSPLSYIPHALTSPLSQPDHHESAVLGRETGESAGRCNSVRRGHLGVGAGFGREVRGEGQRGRGGGRGGGAVGGGWPRKKGRLQWISGLQSLISRRMQPSDFWSLQEWLSAPGVWTAAYRAAEHRYNVRAYRVGELSPSRAGELYSTLQRKFYLNRRRPNDECWYENELRIFVWLLVGYLYRREAALSDLTAADWQFFPPIFNFRPAAFFEYQGLSLLPHPPKAPRWSPQEAALLQSVIRAKGFRNKWNSIARELWVRSGKQHYRNPKQCRQHWMNHLDPAKRHSEWTASEDLILLNTVRSAGRKWSQAVRQLSHTRTQHMVKNRYKSLLAAEAKKQPLKKEQELQAVIIRRLERALPKSEVKLEEIKIEEREPKERKEEEPDELLMGGDFMDSPLPIPWLRDCLSDRQESPHQDSQL